MAKPSKPPERRLLTLGVPVRMIVEDVFPLNLKVYLVMVRYSFHDNGKRHCKRDRAKIEATLRGLFEVAKKPWPFKDEAVANAIRHLVRLRMVTRTTDGGFDLQAEADDAYVGFLHADKGAPAPKAAKKDTPAPQAVRPADEDDGFLDDLLGDAPAPVPADDTDWSNIFPGGV